jgi:hypothetical protein
MRKEKDDKEKEIADLKSLGIDPRKMNELNDERELKELSDNVKQSMFQDYKTAYSEKGGKYKHETESTATP